MKASEQTERGKERRRDGKRKSRKRDRERERKWRREEWSEGTAEAIVAGSEGGGRRQKNWRVRFVAPINFECTYRRRERELAACW